jgi:hypothetical protein
MAQKILFSDDLKSQSITKKLSMKCILIFLIDYHLAHSSARLTLCSRAAAGDESDCATKSANEFDSEAVKSDGASRRVQQIVIL